MDNKEKWECTFNEGWISLTFEKPIIFRGYGLITADVPRQNDDFEEEKKANPSAWTVSVQEAIMKKERDEDGNIKQIDDEDRYHVMDSQLNQEL